MRDAGTCGLVVLRYTDSLTSVIRLKLFLAAVFCGNKICKKVLMCIFLGETQSIQEITAYCIIPNHIIHLFLLIFFFVMYIMEILFHE